MAGPIVTCVSGHNFLDGFGQYVRCIVAQQLQAVV